MRSLSRLLILAMCIGAGPASADQRGVIHKISEKAESYEELAEHYYGKRYLAAHLRMFNRRAEPLPKGTTIIIPTYTLLAVKPKQTLRDFAEANLADAGRADYLAELHDLRGKERQAPRPGTRLKVVQSLKHMVRPGESMKTIARLYYRDVGADRVKLLVLYNKLNSAQVRPGMAIRIPLDGAEFNQAVVSARAKKPFERAAEKPALASATVQEDRKPTKAVVRKVTPMEVVDVNALKETARPAPELDEAMETLERTCDDGDYASCEVDAKKVFDDAPAAPTASRVELLRLRAFAQIALGKSEDSKETFKTLLKLDPEYDLDLYRTSPKILEVFQAVAER